MANITVQVLASHQNYYNSIQVTRVGQHLSFEIEAKCYVTEVLDGKAIAKVLVPLSLEEMRAFGQQMIDAANEES